MAVVADHGDYLAVPDLGAVVAVCAEFDLAAATPHFGTPVRFGVEEEDVVIVSAPVVASHEYDLGAANWTGHRQAAIG